jgi:hypothetical protein
MREMRQRQVEGDSRRLWSLRRACAGQPQRRVENQYGLYGVLIMYDKKKAFGPVCGRAVVVR